MVLALWKRCAALICRLFWTMYSTSRYISIQWTHILTVSVLYLVQSFVALSPVDKVASYDDYASLTRATRVPAPSVVPSLTGGKTSPRFGVAGHPTVACNAPASSRPAAYVPYASMAMTPSDIMHQQMCYQGNTTPLFSLTTTTIIIIILFKNTV